VSGASDIVLALAADAASHALLMARALEARGLATDGELAAEHGELVAHLYEPAATAALRSVPAEVLGHAYEQCLAGASRKAGGVYYTPTPIVRELVESTVGALLAANPEREPATIRVVDPACGTGAFLLGAYDRLLAAQRDHLGVTHVPIAERKRILEECLFGFDLDAHALEVARSCLYLRMIEGDDHQLELFRGGRPGGLTRTLRIANSLEPNAVSETYDVVIGNPPWGQKAVDADADAKQRVRDEFPSSRGIFDWFRPFVELGVRATTDDGYFGMVLPDIVLLKNYEPTRRLLLDELAITRIEWLGMAFAGATIDAVTIAGSKRPAGPDHRVRVIVRDSQNPIEHDQLQADYSRNPRSTLNLHLTEGKRQVLRALEAAPTLGDYFEVHEGIHSGNIRSELFVGERIDESCRELLFGRDELRPFELSWAGRWVRLSAVPERRTRERYANVGRIAWYEQPKVVVRRTGDRITAAVDEHNRFASNNFFVIIPKEQHPLSLHGLCAVLNSAFATWWFRTIEPRKGRAFAEVKIKHLNALPIPASGNATQCASLNELGLARDRQRIEAQVREVLGVSAALAAFDAADMPAPAG
jgi:hypothetical protein